jgi:hypothetical protein
MSFDLYVWREVQPITAERASRVHGQLAGGHTDLVEPDPRVDAFYRELIARFPPLEDLSDEELDSSPWSVSPGDAGRYPGMPLRYVGASIRWSRAQDVSAHMVHLAKRHGLVCFDPQAGRVHNPAEPAPAGGARLTFCDGSAVEDPSPADLRPLLRRLSARNWYAVLERQSGWFLQVGVGPNAGGVPPGQFALEYQEGAIDRHYRAVVGSVDDVAAVFEAFATGADLRTAGVTWTPYALS